MSPSTLPRQAAGLIEDHSAVIPALQATIGLDGFVDEIISVVDQRESSTRYTRVPTIAAFAERLARAAGKSGQVELVVNRVKLGGNGPIMANALAALGSRVTYIGNVGYPAVHPAFAELAARATVLSIGAPAQTDALEFDDGKLMFGKRLPMLAVTWENLLARVGRDRLLELLRDSALIGFQNWTMTPCMSDIWQHLLEELCPQLPDRPRHTFFFDLADPESRTPEDIRRALELIACFQRWFETYLGLNEKESFEIGRVLGYTGPTEGEAAVLGVARFIHDRVPIAGVVVHPRAYAVVASAQGTAQVAGPFVGQPQISTGAGDHFNAGFCLGKLLKADDAVALQIGVATSGYYVRRAQSPTAGELAEFLKGLQPG